MRKKPGYLADGTLWEFRLRVWTVNNDPVVPLPKQYSRSRSLFYLHVQSRHERLYVVPLDVSRRWATENSPQYPLVSPSHDKMIP